MMEEIDFHLGFQLNKNINRRVMFTLTINAINYCVKFCGVFHQFPCNKWSSSANVNWMIGQKLEDYEYNFIVSHWNGYKLLYKMLFVVIDMISYLIQWNQSITAIVKESYNAAISVCVHVNGDFFPSYHSYLFKKNWLWLTLACSFFHKTSFWSIENVQIYYIVRTDKEFSLVGTCVCRFLFLSIRKN